MTTAPAAAPAAEPGAPAAAPVAAPAAPAPAAAPAAPAPAAAPVVLNPGDEGFTVPKEVLDWGANKGYKPEVITKVSTEAPEMYKMMTSYRETEKMLHAATGADKIVLPKDINDFTQVAPALDKLGAPPKGADYKLAVPAGGDNTFVAAAADKMAELKLLPHQASGLNKWITEQSVTIKAAEAAKLAKEGADSARKLEGEWGADLEHNAKIAGRATKKVAEVVGWDANRVEAIKNGNNVTLSAYEFGKLMKYVGDSIKVTGDNFEGDGAGNEGGGGGGMTPEMAKAEINRLTADPAFARKLLAKDAESKKTMDNLYKIAGAAGVTSTVAA